MYLLPSLCGSPENDLDGRQSSGRAFHARVNIMAEIVITICQFAGPAAVLAIGLTLLGIAMGKIRV